MPGEFVYRIGDNPDEIYFIESGDLFYINSKGKVVAKLLHGGFFGEIEMFDTSKRKYYAVAD